VGLQHLKRSPIFCRPKFEIRKQKHLSKIKYPVQKRGPSSVKRRGKKIKKGDINSQTKNNGGKRVDTGIRTEGKKRTKKGVEIRSGSRERY